MIFLSIIFASLISATIEGSEHNGLSRASATIDCPEHSIPPCECSALGFFRPMVRCWFADNVETLIQSMYYMKTSTSTSIQIVLSIFPFIPQDFFHGFQYEHVHFYQTSITSLSDTDIAFHGLEKTLNSLVFKNCNFLQNLEWNLLRNLEVLELIYMNSVQLYAIHEDVSDIAHLNLKRLYLEDGEISHISDHAFSGFTSLTVLSLSSNLMVEIRRSMLPYSNNKLKELDLSYNKLTTLPSDLFSDMPKLETVVLAGNAFATLSETSFAPVWDQLKKLDVLDNPIRCDCRMKWMLDKKFPLNTWGQCAHPSEIKGKELIQLKPVDLWC